jgi:hypothetical protein
MNDTKQIMRQKYVETFGTSPNKSDERLIDASCHRVESGESWHWLQIGFHRVIWWGDDLLRACVVMSGDDQ